jgi:hypothetical protein
MQSYEEILLYSRRRSAIRWPFRLLALVIVAVALFVALGSAYIAFTRKDLRAALLALAAAPLAALIARLGVYAVWTGRVGADPYWPFASGSVAAVWIAMAYILASCV